MTDRLQGLLRRVLRAPWLFARMGGVDLRAYQRPVMAAVVRAAAGGQGGSFAVMFPRQSGKNELQAHIEACLLFLFSEEGGEIVKVAPTYNPQALLSMRRLERVLADHPLTRGRFTRDRGGAFRLGRARISFLSGAPGSNIVGATASLLLEVDEAQDVAVEKFDREIAPMAAAKNAPRVFWGTAWTSATLLSRELREARRSGRAFVVDGVAVGREVPAYAAYLAAAVARLGRDHPAVRTQFFCEELEGQGGLFPPERIAKMTGAWDTPPPGAVFALLVDVGGPAFDRLPVEGDFEPAASGDAAAASRDATVASRDATAATVVWVDLTTLADPLRRAPTYRPVERRAWVGAPHDRLFGDLSALARRYAARKIVVDATGVGAGLASFLAAAFPGRVIPFLFTAASKSRLGYDFLAVVDQGRWLDRAEPIDPLAALFFKQLRFTRCEYAPGQVMRWGVPDGTRDLASGQPVHDDFVLSAALCALLDREPWRVPGSGLVVRAPDPLEDMKGF